MKKLFMLVVMSSALLLNVGCEKSKDLEPTKVEAAKKGQYDYLIGKVDIWSIDTELGVKPDIVIRGEWGYRMIYSYKKLKLTITFEGGNLVKIEYV